MSGYDFDDDLEDVFDSRVAPSHPLANPRLIRDFLDQADAWLPASGEFVAIGDMTPRHALMTAAFILNRSTQVAVMLAAAGAVPMHFVADVTEVRRHLLSTPLVRALMRRGSETEDASVPWASVASRARA